MSNISKTPKVMMPHSSGEISLTKAVVEFKDATPTPCWEKFEWTASDDDKPRLDLREAYDNYAADCVYLPVDTCSIKLEFTVDTTDCLEKAGDSFSSMVKMVSPASRTQIVKKSQPLTRGKHTVSMNILLNRSDFLKLKGLVDCQIVLVKEGDPGTLGDPPKKVGSKVYAMSIGAMLGVSDSDSTLQLVIDDPSAPSSSGMEIEWVDMTDTPNAQYVLDYTNCDDPENVLFRITLQLNNNSHLTSLRNARIGTRADLKKLVIGQISSAVTLNILYDLCNKHRIAIENVIKGSNSPIDGSLLEFCISMLTSVAKSAKMDYEEIFYGIIGRIEDVQKIALRIQDSKEVDSMLAELVNGL